MTDQGELELYADLIRSALNRYKVMRREIYNDLLLLKGLGDETRGLYQDLCERIAKTSDKAASDEWRQLLRWMTEVEPNKLTPDMKHWLQEHLDELVREAKAVACSTISQDTTALIARLRKATVEEKNQSLELLRAEFKPKVDVKVEMNGKH